MKTKKGASELIAYVLLIGFTIALAALVTNWVIDQTKKFNPEDVAGGSKTYCEDVVLEIENMVETGNIDDGLCQHKLTCMIKLKNKGKFTIWGAKALGAGVESFNPDLSPDGIEPGYSKDVIIFFCKEDSGNYIEIVPQIKVEGKKFYCGQTSAIINDDVLTQFNI